MEVEDRGRGAGKGGEESPLRQEEGTTRREQPGHHPHGAQAGQQPTRGEGRGERQRGGPGHEPGQGGDVEVGQEERVAAGVRRDLLCDEESGDNRSEGTGAGVGIWQRTPPEYSGGPPWPVRAAEEPREMPEERASRGPAIATALAVLAVVIATAAAVWTVQRQERHAVEDGLRSALRSMTQILDLWSADQVRGVKAVGAEPRVRESVAALVAGRPAEIESWVKVSSAVRGYVGYLITDSDLRVVASDWPAVLGLPALFASDSAFTGRLRTEGAAITRPLPSAVPFPDAKGVVRVGAPTQFVCAWAALSGSSGGAVCFRIDPLRTFK